MGARLNWDSLGEQRGQGNFELATNRPQSVVHPRNPSSAAVC